MENKAPRYSGTCVYLSGISGDTIAYVTQASDSLTLISRNGHTISCGIAHQNFIHTEEVLYLDVHEEVELMHCFNITSMISKVYKRQFEVNFALKDRYFTSLKTFVRSLSRDIVDRLLPFNFPHFKPDSLEKCFDALQLQQCSDDQRNALAAIIGCPVGSPPILVTGPFGTGKTRILALASHYFLQNCTSRTSILVCTQQHVSADAFISCVQNLLISIPEKVYVVRVRNQPLNEGRQKSHASLVEKRCVRSSDEFARDFYHTKERPYLVVTTCQTAHNLKKKLPNDFFFTHILIDEVAQMREAEAVAPLCLANRETKIVLAGDKQQVL